MFRTFTIKFSGETSAKFLVPFSAVTKVCFLIFELTLDILRLLVVVLATHPNEIANDKVCRDFAISDIDCPPLYPSQRFHSACDLPADAVCHSPVFQSVLPACVQMNKKGVCSQPARPLAELSPPAKEQQPPFCSRCRPNDALMPYVKSHHLLSRLTFHPTAPSNSIDTAVQVC